MSTYSLVAPPVRLDAGWVARFWLRVNKSESCWLWTGSTIRGYGQVHVTHLPGRKTVTWYAHRMSWHLAGRPLHDGLTLDHLCRTPLCVRPDHLEEVTRAENVRRAFAGATHCQSGHEFTEANTITRPDRASRSCRVCTNARQRRNAARRAARSAA